MVVVLSLMFSFGIRDGQCPEYSEEQAICAVGLAKSKPGVFVEAIQYLLVLSTPVEVVPLHFFYNVLQIYLFQMYLSGEKSSHICFDIE